ncbi:hypothetical protein M1116_04120 [Patescibacteria group bacterium]|nr:hypothetical protein [Patescibacteria group bacterium]
MAEVLTVVDGVVTVGKCRCGKVLSLTATSQWYCLILNLRLCDREGN